jgi:hypothetical protein
MPLSSFGSAGVHRLTSRYSALRAKKDSQAQYWAPSGPRSFLFFGRLGGVFCWTQRCQNVTKACDPMLLDAKLALSEANIAVYTRHDQLRSGVVADGGIIGSV